MKSKQLLQGLFIALVALFSLSGAYAQNVITMTTSKKVGEEIKLTIKSEGSFTVQGATHKGEGKYELTATDGCITLKGDVTQLYCYKNQLTQLDVTKNTALEKLDCSYNQLTKLDVTKNTELMGLDCYNNQLTQLDVTKNTALSYLDCSYNQLTKLDVTKNTKLEKLYCYDNQLTQLDVTKNTALKWLYCSNNQLTQLDVTKNTALKYLLCDNNQLTKLDVTKNTALSYLNCSNNQLTQLDVSQNKNLVNLWVYGNRIGRASMNSLVEQLPSISIPEEEKEDKGFFVAVDTKNPNEGNYLTQSSAAKAKSKGWKVRDYNNGEDANGEWNGTGIPYEGESGFITMTTSKKVGEVLSLRIQSEGSFTVQGVTHKGEGKYELTATDGRITLQGDVTQLYCQNNQLTQLDVTKNTALEKLHCDNNQLTQLDVTKNTALSYLDCSYNQLTQLDVTKNTALETLICHANKLTQLDVTKNTALKDLYCSYNQLTQLDVTKNTALKKLDCLNNQLTQLDVTKNTALEKLFCDFNQLTQLDITKNTKLEWLDCSHNQLTHLDVTKNTKLEKLVCYNNQLTHLDVTKNTALVKLSCSENELTQLDVTKNTKLEWLNCYNNQLTQLDVTKNTALVKLSCSENELTQLDVSQNKNLVNLSVSGNRIKRASMNSLVEQLPSISIPEDEEELGFFVAVDTKNPNEGNYLTQSSAAKAKSKGWKVRDYNNGRDANGKWNGEGIPYEGESGFITMTTSKKVGEVLTLWIEREGSCIVEGATHREKGSYGGVIKYELKLTATDGRITLKGNITRLDCDNNQLTQLDVTKNTALEKLRCYTNQLTQLDVTKNTALEKLYCSNNQLTQLDVTKNTKLRELWCSENQLTQLDISQNKDLISLMVFGNRIEHASMDRLVAQLPSISIPEEDKEDYGFFVAVDTKNPNEKNYLTKSSAAKAKSKGWKVFNYNNGKNANGENHWRGVPYEGESGFITMTTSKKVGEELTLRIQSEGSFTVQGVTHKGEGKYELTATDGRITLKGDVTQLYCPKNQLTQLDVTKNTALSYLDCYDNQLTQLDVTKNTALKYLLCDNNQLTQLDISQNKDLINLMVFGNRIDRASMDRLVEQLPSISIPEEEKEYKGFFVAVDTKNPNEGNHLTQSSAAKAKSKGWKVFNYNNGKDASGEDDWRGVPYEGEKDTAIEAISTTSLRLYPNPATDYIKVEGISEGSEVRLLSLDGRLILVAHLDNSSRVDVSSLQRDTYLLQVGNESQIVVLK